MRFTKIKLTGKDSVALQYEQMGEHGYTQFAMESPDEPDPEFRKVMGSLANEVIDLCELPSVQKKLVTVTGVSFKYKADGADTKMGVVITASKKLENSAGAVTMNTPLREEANPEKANPKRDISEKLMGKLVEIQKHADMYLKGHKQQTKLDL